MAYMKTRVLTAGMAAFLIAGLAWTPTAWAGTDLANVAFQKTVTISGTGIGYGKLFTESNTQAGSSVVSGATARQLIVNELVPSWYLNYAYPNASTGVQTSGFWIDLGQEYDLSHIEIQPRRTDRWNVLRNCPVFGSVEKTMDAEYSFTIPGTVGASDATYITPVSEWTGVRWIRIQSVNSEQITVGEIRVFARVPAWDRFIGDVTATASSTYNRGVGDSYTEDTVRYRVSNLVDHTGMTDQGGATIADPAALVGNPDALSRCDVSRGSGVWRSASGGVDGAAVTFDLGGMVNLEQMLVWNYNAVTWSTTTLQYTDRTTEGISDALIEYSSDSGVTWVALNDNNGGDLTNGNFLIPQTEIERDDFGYVRPKDTPYQLAVDLLGITADQVRITTKGNHSAGASTYVGLSEVRFYGERVIPEIPDDIPGDANNDGTVDEVDAKMMANSWGKSGDATWADGDFNGDLNVDARDAAIIAANWLYVWSPPGEASVATAVPEPGIAALWLTLLAGGVTALVRRR